MQIFSKIAQRLLVCCVTCGLLTASLSALAQGQTQSGPESWRRQLRKAVKEWSVGAGSFVAFESKDDDPIYSASVYRHFLLSPKSELRVGVSGGAGSDERFLNISAGGNYLFSSASWTPLIGAEAGLARGRVYVNDSEFESQSGVSYALQGGARFFHLTETQLELMAQYMSIITDDNPAYMGAQVRFIF